MSNKHNDDQDLLIHSSDFLAEAEACEYDANQLEAGRTEAPPWTTGEAVVKHYREIAALHRATAAKLVAEGK